MSKLDELITEFCPKGVEYKTIGEVCEISAGGDVPKEHYAKEFSNEYRIPIYSNGIGENALYGYTDIAKIQQPCVTIAARGTIGYCALRKDPFYPIVRLICAIPNELLIANFLKYIIETITFQVPTSGIPQLTVPMISKYKIPIPPLPVQEEIVRILDNFTELTAELTAELTTELSARKKQYEYYRDKLLTFGDEVEWKTLGEVATLVRGNGLQKKDFTDKGIGCIHYGQIYTYYGTSTTKTKSFVSAELGQKLKRVNKNDIIITNTSENVEDVCKAVAWLGDNEIVTGGHATIIKHNENAKYLVYYTQTSMFFEQKRKLAGGIKVIDVSATNLAKIKIPLPSLTEQERIVAILERFDILVNDIIQGLLSEIETRQKQYEYYRDKLLTFKECEK